MKKINCPQIYFFLLGWFFLLIPHLVLANEAKAQLQPSEIANVYQLTDPEAVDGDIVSTQPNQGIVRSAYSLDQRIFGIKQTKPLVVYRRVDDQGTPVIRNGIVEVNATTLNGPIKPGDYVTSSEIAGKGQRASQSGYVVGVALGSLDDKNGQPMNVQVSSKQVQVYSGKVLVALKIEYVELSRAQNFSRLINLINNAIFRDLQDPNRFIQIFRYMTASVVAIAGFAIGFIAFSRSIPKSVEAIGRNPLAEKAIHFSIVLNIAFSIASAILGLIAAAIIMKI